MLQQLHVILWWQYYVNIKPGRYSKNKLSILGLKSSSLWRTLVAVGIAKLLKMADTEGWLQERSWYVKA
jgi:hypothetical protein